MKLTAKHDKGAFSKALDDIAAPIGNAAEAALRTATDQAKLRARESIASAGFSTKWQNALRGDVYKNGSGGLSTAAAVYHKIPYADVFESGATIRGKPMLWVAMSHTPKKVARKRMTPQRFEESIGELFAIKKGARPLLAASMMVSKTAAKKGPPYKVTLAALRRGAAGTGNGVAVSVPLFVGIPTVSIKKKFKVGKAVQDAVESLPQLYLQNLKVDD